MGNKKTAVEQNTGTQGNGTSQAKVATSPVARPIEKIETPANLLGAAIVQGASEAKSIGNVYDTAIRDTETTIKGLEGRRANALANDETAQRRARNMQMIAGISDGLASLANLIGVGHGGTNINLGSGGLTPLQQKVEQAQKERRADIKSIDDRLDQYRKQLGQMKLQKGAAVVGAKERERARLAERLARMEEHNFQKELLKLRLDASAQETEKAQEYQTTERKAKQDFTASENSKNRANQRAMNDAAKQEAKEAKEKDKPEYRKKVMFENITGIRDELARDMGYKDYNDYLRYKNVSGWGEDIKGQRNKESKAIRAERAFEKPETEELLNMLADPTMLDDSSIHMLIGASKTFADAVGAAEKKPKVDY